MMRGLVSTPMENLDQVSKLQNFLELQFTLTRDKLECSIVSNIRTNKDCSLHKEGTLLRNQKLARNSKKNI
jgi:hypothetical protein